MGYAFYELADGREAGYGVDAQCDAEGCSKEINRGMAYLCGEFPKVHATDNGEWGCGNYHCSEHEYDHSCTNPRCGAVELFGLEDCGEVQGHEMPHRNRSGTEFTWTGDDEAAYILATYRE